MPRPRSVILLSAGLDSTVNLQCAHRATDIARALTFDYGQFSAAREVAAARAMCARLGVRHEVLRLPWLKRVSKSALTSGDTPLPQPSAGDLDSAAADASARAVWVPNRNGVFINIAAAYAEGLDCAVIVTGFNAEEAATFPDNSPQFVRAANRALRLSTMNHPRVISHTQDMEKVAIVRLGREIGAPLDLVWSCYRGDDAHCWRCESCQRLRRALRAAGCWAWWQRARRGTR